MTYTRVSDFISPNVMSLIGVVVAAVSAKFLSHEELKYRQLGVLVFAVRDYIDALDGSIFRERSHSHASGQVGEKTHTIQTRKKELYRCQSLVALDILWMGSVMALGIFLGSLQYSFFFKGTLAMAQGESQLQILRFHHNIK